MRNGYSRPTNTDLSAEKVALKHQDPAPAMVVMPSEDLAKSISRVRIQPSIRSCPALREKMPVNDDDFTLLEMKFQTMSLTLVGAGSPANLASRPVRYLFCDEVDKYELMVREESDPLSLAMERQKTFWNKKTVVVSSPTTESGYIWIQLQRCDVIYDFWVPCPHCGKYQVLKWEGIRYSELIHDVDKDDPGYAAKARDVAVYECEHCHQYIENTQRPITIGSGEYRPRITPKSKPRRIGIHLPSFYSSWLTWGEMAEIFIKAQGDPLKMRNVVNNWWAQPWKEVAIAKTVKEILTNKVDIPRLVCPKGSVALTCGIDPGQGGFWFVVLAWKRDMSPHLVHYGYLVEWADLTQLIHENTYSIHENGEYLSVWKAGIDTGGSRYESENATMTEAAYEWIRKNGFGRVVGTKGRSTSGGDRPIRKTQIDKTPKGKPSPVASCSGQSIRGFLRTPSCTGSP